MAKGTHDSVQRANREAETDGTSKVLKLNISRSVRLKQAESNNHHGKPLGVLFVRVLPV